jgi:diacylglycerol kinase
MHLSTILLGSTLDDFSPVFSFTDANLREALVMLRAFKTCTSCSVSVIASDFKSCSDVVFVVIPCESTFGLSVEMIGSAIGMAVSDVTTGFDTTVVVT